ncbi:DUF4139 domain-containing protein [Novosphingobium jiangmenense]|uniref:DUF4139 domain-containing protein n=1 Tax=Novosphingobium jiangmenense TaxID=2791981 RepID=A0ABS0HDX9_9SPHN|nr:DUF4139 domain-containing protein [Novosphingobium jiangmenense]MBF9150479.1 DUF4139 domain-containing protein [Novosphingobium jiangmenense]
MREVFGLLGVAAPALAVAQTVPTSAQGDVSLTIYNNDLALVQDVRQMSLPLGRHRQEFPDVSAAIRPETVTLNAGGTGIVEQNFDYDLLTPEKLMDKAVGQTVTLIRGADDKRETATILANNGGTIVRVGDHIEVLQNYGARVLFSSLPPGLRARPTLSVTLDTTAPGTRPVSLSYLSRGFGWKADYVALFDETAGKIDVQGWITLTNNSGTTFDKAKVLLVAGAVGDGNTGYNGGYRAQPPRLPGNRPGIESANRESLGDFYVYPIAGRTTVANAQQKQVSFLDVGGAPATKAYHFRNGWLSSQTEPQSADTVLRFSTSREAGLGDALPAGTVRVYMRDARGQPQFIGENAIGHTPMGSSLALKTGEAFDVKVQPVLEKRERIDSGEWEKSVRYRVTAPGKAPSEVTVETEKVFWRTTMSYKVTNAKAVPVTVEVVQGGLDNWRHDTRVPSESIKGEQRSVDERIWAVPVPANGEATLTVQFDTRY